MFVFSLITGKHGIFSLLIQRKQESPCFLCGLTSICLCVCFSAGIAVIFHLHYINSADNLPTSSSFRAFEWFVLCVLLCELTDCVSNGSDILNTKPRYYYTFTFIQ